MWFLRRVLRSSGRSRCWSAAGMFERGGKAAATAKIGDLAVANDVLAKQIKPWIGK